MPKKIDKIVTLEWTLRFFFTPIRLLLAISLIFMIIIFSLIFGITLTVIELVLIIILATIALIVDKIIRWIITPYVIIKSKPASQNALRIEDSFLFILFSFISYYQLLQLQPIIQFFEHYGLLDRLQILKLIVFLVPVLRGSNLVLDKNPIRLITGQLILLWLLTTIFTYISKLIFQISPIFLLIGLLIIFVASSLTWSLITEYLHNRYHLYEIFIQTGSATKDDLITFLQMLEKEKYYVLRLLPPTEVVNSQIGYWIQSVFVSNNFLQVLNLVYNWFKQCKDDQTKVTVIAYKFFELTYPRRPEFTYYVAQKEKVQKDIESIEKSFLTRLTWFVSFSSRRHAIVSA